MAAMRIALLLLLLAQEGPGARAMPRDAQWLKRHEGFVAEARKGGIDVLLLGDSITDAWRGQKALWAERFAPLKAANFGLAGDCTQHLLWRLRNGELEGLRPRHIMLLIGTNNLGWAGQDVEATVDGIKAVIAEIRARTPSTQILLLGLLPRGEKPDDPLRPKIKAVNAAIATLDGTTFLDFGGRLLQSDGTISKELMPDFLHLSDKGYRIWADAVRDPLSR
jgi:lysophospholipase L1-like esterase